MERDPGQTLAIAFLGVLLAAILGLPVGFLAAKNVVVNVKVASGATFQCDATVDGAQKKVPITVTSAGGDYQVGRPA